MLNSRSNTDGAKHSMLPAVFASMAASRVVYAAADPVLAVASLARRVSAIVSRQPDRIAAADSTGGGNGSHATVFRSFLDMQMHAGSMGLLSGTVVRSLSTILHGDDGALASLQTRQRRVSDILAQDQETTRSHGIPKDEAMGP